VLIIYIYIAFMVAFSVVNMVLAVIKIVQFVRAYGGCKHAIVFYVLPIELFSNISMYYNIVMIATFGNDK
jgi:hypothetical protein